MDVAEVRDHRTGQPVAVVSQANPGLIRRDAGRAGAGRKAMQEMDSVSVWDACARAADRFLHDALPVGDSSQTPEDYVSSLSATSGLPHTMCRANMEKIHGVMNQMPAIVRGLSRGLGADILDHGLESRDGVTVSYVAETDSLGVVLPNNSPGVNALWLPAAAMKVPVMIRPGATEPWTSMRLIQALIASGLPADAFGFYPGGHDGVGAVLDACGRGMIFGGAETVARYEGDRSIQAHGPGHSKVIIGPDMIDEWEDVIDVVLKSVLDNGGRSCINASAIIVPARGREIAEALAERAAHVRPRPMDDPDAALAAFANPAVADSIDAAIDDGLKTEGAVDLTAEIRGTPRRATVDGSSFLEPTVIWCEQSDHPLAAREYLFPYVTVVEVAAELIVETMLRSLAVTAITEDRSLIQSLVDSPAVQRLHVGPIPTTAVPWDQPHEGNMFELLYRRRAICTAPTGGGK